MEDETEMVSEDELPSEGDKRVLDTEAVSDEELPTISAGDIPDTEQVSDDELPPVAKRKRKHSSRHSSDSGAVTIPIFLLHFNEFVSIYLANNGFSVK